MGLIGQTFTKSWGEIANDFEKLALSLSEYATFLEETSKRTNSNQSSARPVRELKDNIMIYHNDACTNPLPRYGLLDDQLKEAAEYEPLFFDEDLHCKEMFSNKMAKHRFLNDIQISVPIDILR